MSIVTDPDDLDRFQVAVDPTNEFISLRGLGTARTAKSTAGDVTGASAYQALGETFQTDGVIAGDILTIVSGTNIGHYTVATIPTETTLTINETFPDAAEGAGQTFRIDAPEATGGATPAVADGVTQQALYSFLKEEWRTFDTGLFIVGEAPDLIKFTFPLESITREQFELGGLTHSNWDYADQTTKDLIRTGGWQKQDASGNVIQDYAGILTLQVFDSDAQAYYEQHSAGEDPTDFVLTGPVNQAINTFDEVTGPDGGTGFDISGTDTITRTDGGDWAVDGYKAGGQITIRAAEDAGNNGTFTLLTVGAGVDGAITVGTGLLTNNTNDTTMIAAVNKRSFLRLFVRKKARTYPGLTDLASIGVTTIETIVNRFPLSHTPDPAIVLDDGQMAGDPANTPFRGVETHSTNSNGVAESTPTAAPDRFTFTSAAVSPAFNDGVLKVGDSVEITAGTGPPALGFYEIASIDSATQVTLFKEPLDTYVGGGTAITFTARTGTLDGNTNGALADIGGGQGTLTSALSTFTTDDGLGDRVVSAGDMVILEAGAGVHHGIYKVDSVAATVLTLDTADRAFTVQSSVTFTVVRPRMALERFVTLATEVGPDGGTGFDFNDANPDTIDRNDAGSWIADGYIDGMAVRVTLASIAANNKPGVGDPASDGYIIDAGGVAAGTLTLLAEETLTADTLDTTAVFNGEVGIVRIPNATSGEPFPFHWRLFANGGTIAECFQFIQRQLRRATDIDVGDGTSRGDVTDLLMSFASPNGVTFDMFIDDLASADRNNITFGDLTGDTRGFPFISGLSITLNDNLTNDSSAKVVVFFDDADGTPANGDEFGTVGAIIVDDDQGVDMQDTTPLANPLQFNFDYDNNAQGGRTPGTDADLVIVGIGLETAQYVQLRNPGTVTIKRQNSNPFSLTAPLERNYSP
jgi:hypothetical protein